MGGCELDLNFHVLGLYLAEKGVRHAKKKKARAHQPKDKWCF